MSAPATAEAASPITHYDVNCSQKRAPSKQQMKQAAWIRAWITTPSLLSSLDFPVLGGVKAGSSSMSIAMIGNLTGLSCRLNSRDLDRKSTTRGPARVFAT